MCSSDILSSFLRTMTNGKALSHVSINYVHIYYFSYSFKELRTLGNFKNDKYFPSSFLIKMEYFFPVQSCAGSR